MPKATDGERWRTEGGGTVSVDLRRSAKVGGRGELLYMWRCLCCPNSGIRHVSFSFLGGVRCERCTTIKGHAHEKETMFTESLRGATPGGEFSLMTTRGFEVC